MTDFSNGRNLALRKAKLTRSNIDKLKINSDFWDGFHSWRPFGVRRLLTCILEDPTRPGGWCCVPYETNLAKYIPTKRS